MRLNPIISLFAVFLLALAAVTTASDSNSQVDDQVVAAQSPAAGEQINWQVLSSGGGRGTSANYILISAVGQTAAGPGSSASYNLNSGFIQNFTTGNGCCVGNRGDINGDSADADPVDLSYLVDFLFSGGAAPVCNEEADLNGDLSPADPVDLSYLVDFLFSGGAAPFPC